MYNGIGLTIQWEDCEGMLLGTYGEMPNHQDKFRIYSIQDDIDVEDWYLRVRDIKVGDAVLQRCAAYSGSPIWHKAFTSVAEAKRYAQYGDRGVVGDEVAV